MKNSFKIIILPSKEETDIHETRHGRLYYQQTSFDEDITYQHLYILSNDKIQQGDWFVSFETNKKYRLHAPTLTESVQYLKISDISACKKILATTDQEYINESIPQIPQSFVEHYVEVNGKIDEVELECEDFKDNSNRVFEQAKNISWKKWSKMYPKFTDNNEVIICQDKTYTREEIETLITNFGMEDSYSLPLNRGERRNYILKWIKENLS